MQASARNTIFVDADACPVRIRDLIAKAAHRRKVEAVFVANKPVLLLQSAFLSCVQVPPDPDAADAYIEERAKAGDLVVTQDIPLAASLCKKAIGVITPRGLVITDDNVADLLSRRDLMTELRDVGQASTRTPPLNETVIRNFASAFDAALQRLLRGKTTEQS
jgi:uncharacterized protein YaiI (UPF0178 family)